MVWFLFVWGWVCFSIVMVMIFDKFLKRVKVKFGWLSYCYWFL